MSVTCTDFGKKPEVALLIIFSVQDGSSRHYFRPGQYKCTSSLSCHRYIFIAILSMSATYRDFAPLLENHFCQEGSEAPLFSYHLYTFVETISMSPSIHIEQTLNYFHLLSYRATKRIGSIIFVPGYGIIF